MTATPAVPTLVDRVRWIFPWASMREVEDLLWETTAYPFAPWPHLERQLLANKLVWESGQQTCDHCSSPGFRAGLGYFCDGCYAILHRPSPSTEGSE